MRRICTALGLPALLLGAVPGQNAGAADWSGAEALAVTLFHPGQASWQWALTAADHSGAAAIRNGTACRDCHGGEEAAMGALIAGGGALEPASAKIQRSSLDAEVRAVHDGERLTVRISWPAPAMAPARVSMIIGDDAVAEARRAGCWSACHDDAVNMASAAPGAGLTKYLARSRTEVGRQGGGTRIRARADLDRLLADGGFMEYWEAAVGGDATAAADGYILDSRRRADSPLVDATARYAEGRWTVELSRALAPGQPGRKDIVPGKVYTVGFAIHDAGAADRFHLVSFEHTLALDSGDADLVARGP